MVTPYIYGSNSEVKAPRQLGVPLAPGVYNNAQGAGAEQPGHPGMSLRQELDGTVEARNTSSGRNRRWLNQISGGQ